jgi:Domain of unknown function (DUF397)
MAEHDLSRAVWRKSAYSGGATNCVEVAGSLPAIVAVRDSKDPAGPALTFGRRAWDAFTGQVKDGKHGQSGQRLEAPHGGDPADRIPFVPLPR